MEWEKLLVARNVKNFCRNIEFSKCVMVYLRHDLVGKDGVRMIKSLETLGAVHTHTHTQIVFSKQFCFLACNFLVAGVVFCAHNLIEFISKLAF